MTTRRVVIGRKADGNFGLRVASSGYDAYSDADNLMTFDSNWTDIVKVVQAGLVSVPANTNQVDITIVSLGYKPYVECRKITQGSPASISDDYNDAAPNGLQFGIGMGIISDGLLRFQYPFSVAHLQLLLVYSIPVPV